MIIKSTAIKREVYWLLFTSYLVTRKNIFVRKCRKQATYRHNLQILCQSREDNPLHTVAFNELIENLKETNTTWSNTMLDCERSVSRTLFMDENSDRSH